MDSKDTEIDELKQQVAELATSLLFTRGYIAWLRIAVHGMAAASDDNLKQVFPTVSDIAGRIEAFAVERGERAHEILTGKSKPVQH